MLDGVRGRLVELHEGNVLGLLAGRPNGMVDRLDGIVDRFHGNVDRFQRGVDGAPRLKVPRSIELLGECARQRFVDDEARPIVPARRVARVQLRAYLLEQWQRVGAPQQSTVQRGDQRYGALDAERELRRDHERYAALVKRVGEARTRADDRPDVAAVAACHRNRGRPMNPAVDDARERAAEALAGDDVGIRLRTAKDEAVRMAVQILCRVVEVAVREKVHVRVPRFAALPKDIGQRRIDEDRQQIAELLAHAAGGRRNVAPGMDERPDRFEQRVAMLPEGNDIGISGHEQDPWLMRPHDAFGRHVPNVPGHRDRRSRLDREPAFGGRVRSHGHLRELEWKECQLRRRHREAKVNRAALPDRGRPSGCRAAPEPRRECGPCRRRYRGASPAGRQDLPSRSAIP